MHEQQSTTRPSPPIMADAAPAVRIPAELGAITAQIGLCFWIAGAAAAGGCILVRSRMQGIDDFLDMVILLLGSWILCACALIAALIALFRSSGKHGRMTFLLTVLVPVLTQFCFWYLPAHQ